MFSLKAPIPLAVVLMGCCTYGLFLIEFYNDSRFFVSTQDSIPANSLQYYYALNDTDHTYGVFTWVSISPTLMDVVYIDGKGKEVMYSHN